MPDQIYYSQTHEWVRVDQDGLAMVGLSPDLLTIFGAVDAIELPEPGRNVARGEVCATLHRGATLREVHAPLSGTIAEHNATLSENPASLTALDWLFRMRLADAGAFAALMTEGDYAAYVKSGN